LYSYSRLFISRFLMIFKGCFHESQESLVFLCTVKSVELKLTQFHEPPLLMKFIFSSMIWVRDVRRKSSTTAMACCYRKINHEKKNRLVSMHVVQHSWTHIWALFKVAVSAPPEPGRVENCFNFFLILIIFWINIFFIFSYHFNMLILKIIF